jgi:hypothetical protein
VLCPDFKLQRMSMSKATEAKVSKPLFCRRIRRNVLQDCK